jgi:hypothetical protein
MLNLGPEAFDAVSNLKSNRDWKVFKAAVHEQMQKLMHAAIDAGTDRDMAIGYARAVRDMMATIETFEDGPQRGGRPQRPGVSVNHREAAHVR